MNKFFCLVAALVMMLVGPVFAATMQSIGKDEVNVRSKPDLNSEVLFELSLGYPIQVEKQQDNWVYFTDWKNQAGWVFKPLVSKTQTAVILVDNANIRKGPSLSKPVVMKASQGAIYKIFGEKDDWVHVGYYLENEKIGWIRDDLVWGE
ncbi:MAG: peptide-binding protein [Deltaproteobacteria bacterium CG07_land_8_20_14_0_80_60_11]|nr:MAG: peptide-binding protein [Deltaproteobacteria bacterium CG07_land_8_20_14_0_80_60_11]